MTEGFQINTTHMWIEAHSLPNPIPDGHWEPIIRNGGPKDGQRLGTARWRDDQWDVELGRDEDGNVLPGCRDLVGHGWTVPGMPQQEDGPGRLPNT